MAYLKACERCDHAYRTEDENQSYCSATCSPVSYARGKSWWQKYNHCSAGHHQWTYHEGIEQRCKECFKTRLLPEGFRKAAERLF